MPCTSGKLPLKSWACNLADFKFCRPGNSALMEICGSLALMQILTSPTLDSASGILCKCLRALVKNSPVSFWLKCHKLPTLSDHQALGDSSFLQHMKGFIWKPFSGDPLQHSSLSERDL